jgi:hypothetical protein
VLRIVLRLSAQGEGSTSASVGRTDHGRRDSRAPLLQIRRTRLEFEVASIDGVAANARPQSADLF